MQINDKSKSQIEAEIRAAAKTVIKQVEDANIAFVAISGDSKNGYEISIYMHKYLATLHRIEKPVIYLYPQTQTSVSVKLALKDSRFIMTDPQYQNGWCVLAGPDGALINLADGKRYPYLFWEAEGPPILIKQGFLVKREDTEVFLREKLSYIGLLPHEYEEFIEYWLPVLQKNEYNLIYFAGEEYTSQFPLFVTPQPDSMLRVFMVAKAADGTERIAPQTLRPYERKGFAVIEWGGTLLE